MQLHQKILTGLLLVLTGIMFGMIAMVYHIGYQSSTASEVRVVEVKRSIGTDTDSEGFTMTSSFPDLRDIASAVTPTVVYIETLVPLRRGTDPEQEFENGEGLFDRLIPRRRASSIGSGILISPDGYILTNNHVIAGADTRSITVGLIDKRVFHADIVGRDPSTDLAVLKIDEIDLPHIIIGNSDHLHVGEWVVAIGNPFRLRSTVTAGIVSALGRNVDIINDQMRIESFIQTDAAINRGNSGGALVNQYGELVGINTAIATENGAYQGYGFAIPINLAYKIARDFIEFGEVRRAYLGVQILAVTQDRSRQLGMNEIRGVEIVNLVRNGAASRSGLRSNDIILAVNGKSVNEANELQAEIALHRPGDNVIITVWRNSQIIEIDTRLAGLEDSDIRDWLSR